MTLRPADFKSAASAIPPCERGMSMVPEAPRAGKGPGPGAELPGPDDPICCKGGNYILMTPVAFLLGIRGAGPRGPDAAGGPLLECPLRLRLDSWNARSVQ